MKKRKGKGNRGIKLPAASKAPAVGVDTFQPGRPYKVAAAILGHIPIKTLKISKVCVFKDCTKPCPVRGKWCAEHFPVVRSYAMAINRDAHRAKRKAQKIKKAESKEEEKEVAA